MGVYHIFVRMPTSFPAGRKSKRLAERTDCYEYVTKILRRRNKSDGKINTFFSGTVENAKRKMWITFPPPEAGYPQKRAELRFFQAVFVEKPVDKVENLPPAFSGPKPRRKARSARFTPFRGILTGVKAVEKTERDGETEML